ncbi:thioredoxin [Deinococcus soli (ex Cha et al. 2016)]|uniref:Glutaredoxin n=2 Tax=Deinococcus soli (ex Cha et al. 2016) TaxID=1309411 RepID=A0ACC6KCQ1_9DEIO|nr:thioredoxin [Deinococcus soli (ex Cha et al. 2016)]MDR6217667.1 glutaredoxin [Deinococcus soli (ex Cha et al. 2016)]MDR6326976.1 glutaredoxin [Deinococcus soli (ex Cha et al. 2016)]MDR6750298.1 glutaredoxin [Deinococcus soli (ex Cha et al. 2016)]
MTDPRPFVLFTQDQCPQCETLKRMLTLPLRGAFDDQIEVLHRQQNPDAFTALADAHGLARTPALLHRPSGKLLLDTGSLGAVKAFLTQS